MKSTLNTFGAIVVVGGSAGAIEPLRYILSRLPSNFPAPIFVTIHVPSDFPSLLPEVLKCGPLITKHPTDRESINNGIVYVAPADLHLLVEKGCVHVSRGARENRHRPAIDPMFRSAARSYGTRVIGIILSGQLDDGSAGLMAVKMRGGITVVQNPEESLSPEMPHNAITYAHPARILTAEEIAAFLIEVTKKPFESHSQTPENRMTKEFEDESCDADLEHSGNKEQPGKPSPFACPECHGVLWEVDDNGLLRFRCRVGHAYTAEALRVALSESTEDALWAAMRVMEEKAALLRRMALRSSAKLGKKYSEEAEGYDTHVKSIRKMLMENQGIENEETKKDVA